MGQPAKFVAEALSTIVCKYRPRGVSTFFGNMKVFQFEVQYAQLDGDDDRPGAPCRLSVACATRAARLLHRTWAIDIARFSPCKNQVQNRPPMVPVTNVRNLKSPYWRGWLKAEWRCLVPATSFCEWTD